MRRQEAQEYFKQVISKYTAINPEQIDSNTNFQDFGINSFMMLEMIEEVEGELGIQLSKTIFFQCLNLQELSSYFEKNYPNLFTADKAPSEQDYLVVEDVI